MLVSAMVSARTLRILVMMTGAFGSVIHMPMSKTAPAAAPFPFDPVPNARNGWFKVGGELRWGRWSTKDSKKVHNPALLTRCHRSFTMPARNKTLHHHHHLLHLLLLYIRFLYPLLHFSTYVSSTSSFFTYFSSNPFCRSLFLDRPSLMLEARSPFCPAFLISLAIANE
jgi:hypothetical protein